ncbi:MAG: glycosyltransferase [Magnetococcales bacterium]|nr:glycosyltransferase [Magnetococcales bacterium]
MDVLVVSSKYPPEYAGSGLRIHRTWKRLLPMLDARVRVLCGSVEYDTPTRYDWEGIPVQRLASPGWRALERATPDGLRRLSAAARFHAEFFQALGQLRSMRCDLVHVVGMCPATSAAIAWARARDLPLVVELVNTGAEPFQPPPGLARAWRFRLDRRTLVVAISGKLREICVRFGLEANAWQRPNPVDEGRFYPPTPHERDALRRSFTPFGPDDRVVTWVANFIPGKNQGFLVEMLARLPEHFKLVLAGPLVENGPLGQRNRAHMAAIRQRIAELGLARRVHLVTGFVDAAAYTRLADVVAIPSLAEGLSTPMLEGLACGCPVVANGGEPAFRDWIRDDDNGFLPPLDAEIWARSVAAVAAWPETCRRRLSAEVLAQASTRAVDGAFVRLVRALRALPPDGTLDVSAALA